MIKVMSCSYGGNSGLVEDLRPMIEELGMSLITIHEWDSANIKWESQTWRQNLSQADIIVVPSNYELQPAKSANRVTQAMALGKPVICSPLQAYLDVEASHPDCLLVARSKEEWKGHLVKLRDDEAFRKNLGQRALTASKDYFIDAVGAKWVNALFPEDTSVDIIIPVYNHEKCLKYLKLCIEGIKKCTIGNYRIFAINNGSGSRPSDNEFQEYLSGQENLFPYWVQKATFAQAINKGIEESFRFRAPWGVSKYVCILNDDVIVSKGWMQELLRPIQENDKIGAVGPLSNCDKTWLHNYDINIGGVDLLPGSNTFEQMSPIISQIYNYQSPYSECPKREWVAFYCTLIPREVIHRVGILDEGLSPSMIGFENSGEDVDYCYRIRKMGYEICQNYKSFVFHYGAISRKALESEDKNAYQAADKRTNLYLREKYDRKNVVIYSGPGWHKWDYRNIDGSGIGGSETWQVHIARELDKLGYRVKSFCDCSEPGIKDGNVEYLHWTPYNQYIDANYIISSRTTDPFKYPLRAGKTFVQIHDVWLLSERNQILLDKVGKFAVLSDWHAKFAGEYHGIPDDKFVQMTNGLDFSRYDSQKIEREPYRMFYSSSADRGLDTLLYLFPFIKAEIPQLELHIYYGFDVWELAVRQRNNLDEIKNMEEIKQAMKQPGVFYHGRIGQKELAAEQLKSSLWAYPTSFEETFSITAIEAQYAGCPVIASNYAGLQTTVGSSGILLGNGNKGESYTKEYREKFVAECINLLTHKDKWQYWSERGFENAKKYSWSNVAQKWKELFES